MPKVEMLVAALQSEPMPVHTLVRLMQYYERIGEFAKAEDALFAMLAVEPGNRAIVDLGIAFCQRLLTHSDATLGEGKLPRVEVEEAFRELQSRPS